MNKPSSVLRSRFQRTARTIGMASLLGIFGLVATGCGPAATTTKSRPPVVRIWRVNQDVDVVRDLVTEFQKTYAGVKVTYEKKDLEGYELAALKSLAARQGPDIWSIPNDWLGDHEDRLIPLPDNFFFEKDQTTGPTPAQVIKARYVPGIADQLIRIDGKVYGLPTNVDALRLYYNPDILATALKEYRRSLGDLADDDSTKASQQLLKTPPKTWTDLIEQTKYITKRDGNTLLRSTIALGTADNLPNSGDLLQLLILQNGATVVSSDRKRALFHESETTPTGSVVRPGEKALDFYTSFANPAKQNYSWNPSMPSALDAFAQGKVAMVIAFNDFEQQLKIKYPKFRAEKTLIPQISTSATPVNFIRYNVEAVTQTADNQSAAFAFLKEYTNESYTKALASEQKLKTPYLKSLNNASDDISKMILTGQSVFKKSRPEFNDIFRQMIIDVSQNSVAVGSALDSGAEKVNQLLIRK